MSTCLARWSLDSFVAREKHVRVGQDAIASDDLHLQVVYPHGMPFAAGRRLWGACPRSMRQSWYQSP